VEHDPGETALVAGWYRLLNVLGTPTKDLVLVDRAQAVPAAPRGYAWRLERPTISALSAAELLERAAELRTRAVDARARGSAESLIRLAERFEALAADRGGEKDA
jgi:hypothetical protein